MLGVAYGYAISSQIGLLVAVFLAAVLTVAMVTTAPVIEVTPAGVLAKRAFLPAEYFGSATALDPREAKVLRGVGADARGFTVLRGWLTAAVRLEVADDLDPTPYWYLSTAQPDALAAALNQVRRASNPIDVEGFENGAPATQEE